MAAPADITPVLLGISLPSAANWMAIFLGLYFVYAILGIGSHMYWHAVAEDQFADPARRQHMNLGVTAGPFSNRYRAIAERLAEPERSVALRWNVWLLVYFVVVTAAAVLIFSLYFTFVI